MTDLNSIIISINGGMKKKERDLMSPYKCQNNVTTAFCLFSPLGNNPLGHASHFTDIFTCLCMFVPHRCVHKVISASTKKKKKKSPVLRQTGLL